MSTNRAEQELIGQLRDVSGGLNWLDEYPRVNEFVELKDYDLKGDYLRGRLGRTGRTVGTVTSFYGQGKHKNSSTGDTYSVVDGDGKIHAYKLDFVGATYVRVDDLDGNLVTLDAHTNSNPATIFQIRDQSYIFQEKGVSSKNLVAEEDGSTASDFALRKMGITEPNLLAVLTTAASTLSGTFRYRVAWIRKINFPGSGSSVKDGDILSHSGIAAASNNTFSEITASLNNILVSITATSDDTQITHARIYRTFDIDDVDNDPTLFLARVDLLTTVTAGVVSALTTFSDVAPDVELQFISGGTVLQNAFRTPFPECRAAVNSGGRNWCSDGKKVFFSSGSQVQGALEYHDPAFGFLDADNGDGELVNHITVFAGNVILIKDSKTGIIYNSDPSNLIVWTDKFIGSTHRASIVETPIGLIGLTNRGVFLHDGVRWGTTNLSIKVIENNQFDKTRRILPADNNDVTRPDASGFYFDNRYYLSISDNRNKSSGVPSKSTIVLDFLQNFQWVEHRYRFDYAFTFDASRQVWGIVSGATNNGLSFFDSLKEDGEDINGLFETGFVVSPEGSIDVDDTQLYGKFDKKQTYTIKSFGDIQSVSSDIRPDPVQNELNTFYDVEMNGFKTFERFKTKLEGVIDNDSVYYGQRIKWIQVENQSSNSKQTTGLLARYNFDDSAGIGTTKDFSGNAMDLTFSRSTTTITITTDVATRAIAHNSFGVLINNGGAENSGYVGGSPLTGIAPNASFSLMFKAKFTDNGGDTTIFRSTANSRDIDFIYLGGGTEKVILRVGDTAHSFTPTIADGTIKTVVLTYRYLKGVYNTPTNPLTFKTELYIDGVVTNGSATASTAASTTNFEILLDTLNDKWELDDFRIYGRKLSSEEVIGLTNQFYANDTEFIDK